jgi:hypothetical protein
MIMETKSIAKCKEPNIMQAVFNGHGNVWPECEVRFKDGWAYFYRDNMQLWDCNEQYAIHNFEIIKQ